MKEKVWKVLIHRTDCSCARYSQSAVEKELLLSSACVCYGLRVTAPLLGGGGLLEGSEMPGEIRKGRIVVIECL